MTINKLRIMDENGRRQFWVITESVHANGKVYVNVTRSGKVRTIRVR